MNEFEQNHPKELENFLNELHRLIDNYHHEIYLIDGIFEGYGKIVKSVVDEIADFEERNK
jgi:hypothetical protein